jgi:NAD+ diphosphatase
MDMNYCRRCGNPLTSRAPHEFKCSNGHTIYQNPSPTVGIFLLDVEGNIILAVRGIEPGKGGLDSIGGFVDGDESLEQAIEREMLEETGLGAENYSSPRFLISSASSYDFDGETNIILSCFYVAELLEGAEPHPHDDVASFVRVRPNKIDIHKLWNDDVRTGIRALLEVLS